MRRAHRPGGTTMDGLSSTNGHLREPGQTRCGAKKEIDLSFLQEGERERAEIETY